MKFFLLASLLVVSVALAAGQPLFQKYFTGATLRVDYYHTGTKGEERLSLDCAIREGSWPGHRVNLVDTLNLGEYLLRAYDVTTNALLYSRGYSSVFNEWQTTDEAGRGMYRTFSESVRMPFPRRAIQVTIGRRDKRMEFHEVFSAIIDPEDPTHIRKETTAAPFPAAAVMNNGDPSEKVDIVIIGDGYAAADMAKFREDARKFNEAMFRTHPFKERRKDFNVWRVDAVSRESGIDVPDKNTWKDNVLGTKYNTFGSARYVLTEDNKALRTIAAAAPYDFICILVNDARYGGGGIFNLYATTYTGEAVAGQEWQMEYVYVHEFGHSFAGLGDEYYTSSTAYNDFYLPGIEPWEPNVAALVNKGKVKWGALASPGLAIPTPWAKASYDSIEAIRQKLDRLAPDYYEKREPLYRAGMDLLRNPAFAGKVGAFEGAGYATKGLYRPSLDCRMFSLSLVDFDPVCSAAINRMADLYSARGEK
jgi:hypothetical protein